MSEEDSLTCDNCKLKIASQNFVMHTAHCARHLELCKTCGEPVPKGQLNEHISTEHANEDCPSCGKSIEKSLLQKHAQTDCPKRLISCLYCELELPSGDMIAHADYCGTRTEKCLDCGEFVMLKYTQLHLESNHKFLKLEDEPGPSASWQENKASASSVKATSSVNVMEATLLPCEFCNGMFTPRELRRHQVSCKHGWTTTIPVVRPLSVVQCGICKKSIASNEYEAHCVVCDQRNQSNGANSNIIPCDICDKAIPFDEYKTHHTLCSRYPFATPSNTKQTLPLLRKESVIPCDVCNESIALDDYQRHRIFCIQPTLDRSTHANASRSITESVPKLPCEFCEKSFSANVLAAHQICCSPIGHQTSIPCELCGQLKPLAEVLEHQMTCRIAGDY